MRAADDTRRLDAWLPEPVVRTHHRRTAAVDAGRAVARGQRRCACPTRARSGGSCAGASRASTAGLTYGELFRAYPFTVLDEGERHLLAGLCGRIWTLARDYPRARRAGGVRGLGRARHRARAVRPLGRAGRRRQRRWSARRASQPVDRTASLRLRALWKRDRAVRAARRRRGDRRRRAGEPAVDGKRLHEAPRLPPPGRLTTRDRRRGRARPARRRRRARCRPAPRARRARRPRRSPRRRRPRSRRATRRAGRGRSRGRRRSPRSRRR